MNKTSDSLLKNLQSDLPASIVVFLVALPLCLGIALGSQAPLMAGIVAGVVGGIVIGVLSGSQLSVSGPAAGLTAIVVAALEKLPAYEAFLVAVVIGGVLQLLFGFIKAGVIGDYIPSSVIKGMLAAIGLILILKQFPHMVGYDADYEGDESFFQQGDLNTFSGIFEGLSHVLPWAFMIGLTSLVLQVVWEKWIVNKGSMLRLVPAPLVVVVAGVVMNQFAISSFPAEALSTDHLVSLPVAGSAKEFFSFFVAPDFSFISNPQVWITALTLAIVASLETLLCIEAADNLDPLKRVTPTNRELKAQGVGNVVSGLLGGLPVTSVIVRTSANINSGARTKSSVIFHGLLLAVSVVFFPHVMNMIPKSALAAVLIYTGYKLAKPSLFRDFYRRGLDQFFPFVITIAAILLTDLLIGILIGCLVGLFFVIKSNFHSAVVVVNDEKRYLFRMRKDVSYLNKPVVKRKLEEIPADSYVLIDLTRADYIDKDVIGVIEDFQKHASLKNITVELKFSAHRNQGFSS
ncbi:MAG: SulP family inorganic anion transporter [Bacteroidota bacterium]